MDLVSIVIPYFKKRKFIDKSISSILNQTYSNYEILIIYDDEDQTDLNYLFEKYNSNKKIKFFINKKNLGAGLSRNIGIENAKGTYIAFIDADDIWNKNKLERQILFMKTDNIQACHTSYQIIDENDKIIGQRKARSFLNLNELIKSCDIGLSTVVIERKVFKINLKFPNIKTKEDFVLWLKMIKNKVNIIALDENLLSWRRVNQSLSNSIFRKLIDGFKVYYIYMGYNFLISFYYLICLSINYLWKRIDE